jgi:hypothetical protein
MKSSRSVRLTTSESSPIRVAEQRYCHDLRTTPPVLMIREAGSHGEHAGMMGFGGGNVCGTSAGPSVATRAQCPPASPPRSLPQSACVRIQCTTVGLSLTSGSLFGQPVGNGRTRHSLLVAALRRPIDPVESVPTALRTHLVLAAEARTTGLALVWAGVIRVTAHDCRFHAAQSAHCEFLPRKILPVHEPKVFSHPVVSLRDLAGTMAVLLCQESTDRSQSIGDGERTATKEGSDPAPFAIAYSP